MTAWFRIKWLDEFKQFVFSIETGISESRFSITRSQAEDIIEALQKEKEELIFEVE